VKKKVDHTLEVLVYREDELWLAHCLDLDLVAQADTPDAAINGIIDALDVFLADAAAHGRFFEELVASRRAPEELWERLRHAKWRHAPLRHKPSFGGQADEVPTVEIDAGLELCGSGK
jgi:hypothetical protein